MTTDRLTLWGSPHSFYTGKVRSYLIKKGLPFREQTLAHSRFQAQIVSRVRLMVVPVLEFPDGRLLQDSADIIETLEARFPDNPMIPATPCSMHRSPRRRLRHRGTLAPGIHRWSQAEHTSCG
jgi:glutathione S-transferase